MHSGRQRGRPLWAAGFFLLAAGMAYADAGARPTLDGLDGLPMHAAPAAATAKALGRVATDRKQPPILAVNVDLPLGLDDGVWDQPTPDSLRWRTRVYSAGADSLLLALDHLRLPAGAELWFYDAQGRVMQGPYTRDDIGASGQLWTPIVPGEIAVLEIDAPAGQQAGVELTVAKLGHGLKNGANLGAAGACNIDSICPLGNAWRNEARATAKLQIPDGTDLVRLCTGTLVNNLRQDGTPYMLTASHCGIGKAGSPADGVVVYWQFANTQCGVNDAEFDLNQTGVTLLATDPDTDFTLIRLNEPPKQSFSVYYAGWDASGAGADSGVSLHHPGGDARKISEFNQPLTRADFSSSNTGTDVPAWRVERWNQGTTEGGSSGAGLWNQDHYLIGTLAGGLAACDGTAPSDDPDFFARLASQWTARAEPGAQLKFWLDPDNTGVLRLIGRNPPGSNTAPLPRSDSYDIEFNSTDTVLDVLANDGDADGDTITLTSFTQPLHGQVRQRTDTSGRTVLLYTPEAGYIGDDSFTYTISDSRGGSAGTIVSLKINPLPLDDEDADLKQDLTGGLSPVLLAVLLGLAGLARRSTRIRPDR